jgi:hypothetical protein
MTHFALGDMPIRDLLDRMRMTAAAAGIDWTGGSPSKFVPVAVPKWLRRQRRVPAEVRFRCIGVIQDQIHGAD